MRSNFYLTFDIMLHLSVSREEDILKHIDQLKTTDKIIAFVKPISRDGFTCSNVNLLHSITVSSLEFYKSI